MKTSSRNVFYALIATVLLSACSRPYATYQKMPVEHFGSKKNTTTSSLPIETVSAETKQLAAVTPPPVESTVSTPKTADLDKAQAAVDQVIASTSNKATGNKLQKSMDRVRAMLGTSSTQSTQESKTATVVKKKNLVERLMLKNVDKKIKRALAPKYPNAPKAVNIFVTVGAIVALVGLIVVLASTSDGIGLTLLVVGLVLLLVGLIV